MVHGHPFVFAAWPQKWHLLGTPLLGVCVLAALDLPQFSEQVVSCLFQLFVRVHAHCSVLSYLKLLNTHLPILSQFKQH